MTAYVPRLFVHEDGRMVISVRTGDGIGHGVGFRWLMIDPDDLHWVEPMSFPDFVEVMVMHPSMLAKAVHGRNW